MPSETLKIVIPMAGFGTRLRPHTWSKPKQLVSVAGKTALGHLLDQFSTLPDPENVELIFIVGYLGEQMQPYMGEHYPQLKVHYVEQAEMKGQSHAIYMARELLGGPMLMVFADTLIETDFSFLAHETAGGVAWVKAVPDPRRFGVVELNAGGRVTRLIEKPTSLENNLVVVGFYYFRDSRELLSAIEEQMVRGKQLKGEYFLADAVNIMIERGLNMRTQEVEVWLDAGTPETVLETNRYLLTHGRDNTVEATQRAGVIIVPPVFIHPSARVEESVIGPHVSVGAGCRVVRSVLQDAILEDRAEVVGAHLSGSLIGRNATVTGQASIINVGDHSVVTV